MHVSYCGYWFEQLILISVFYIPDKISVISPKQRISNDYIAIIEAAEHAIEVVCCKSIQVKQCLPKLKKIKFSFTFSRWREKARRSQMFKL